MTAQTTRFKKKLVVRALMLAFSATAITAGLPTDAFAQSNATGNIYGQVTVPAGTSIVIENKGTGAKRTVTPDATGRFQVTSLPVGDYRVQLVRDGKVTETNEVEVIIGQGAEVRFAGSGQSLQTVQVVSRRATIDVSSTNNGATFTSKDLDQLPIARTVDAIIALAPNTTRADPRYANNAASFGGGAPSENSYYINGFPVTNPLNQLGSSQLPFGAIDQAQVLTGGFGAEFGRSIGGVVNITTKSGTNEWHGGVQYSIEPSSLRGKYKDILYPNTGDPTNAATDGTLYRRRSVNKLEEQSYGFYIGGPIIKDKLFMFVAAEETKDKFSGVNPGLSTVNIASGDVAKWGWSEQRDTTTRYMGKVDWNITDNHHLELTMIGDQSKRNENLSGYDYTTGARNGVTGFTANYKNAPNVTPVGMDDTILKYTGYLTDDLTVTALYGEGKSPHSNSFVSPAGGFPEGVVLSTTTAVAPGVTYANPNALAGGNVNAPTSEDKVKAGRFDLEYKLGKHTIRGGLDEVRLISHNAGDIAAGGGTVSYRFSSKASGVVCSDASCTSIHVPGTLGMNGYFGRERIFRDVTDAYSDQSAQYIEDRYQVSKNLLLTFGLRNESFTNKNNAKETFLEQKNVLSPRFSAAWDVLGDASFKVFGSAGRYSVQIPTHIAVRGAGPSLLTDQYFTYTGVDPVTGQPTGRVNVSNVFSPNNELNQPKDARTLAATNLKPNQQDEITLGFEKALNPDINYGARVTYRKLVNTIDDFCDQTPFDNYAAAHGIDESNWAGFNCASINPGRTNTFLVDYAGTGTNLTPVTLTAADMGFTEKAKRTYTAIDLFLEHPFRNGWYGRVNYTWSRSTGNTEGQTLSDIGQTDVAATQTWDNQYVMQYANGLLPNDRTHQIKAYGYYALTPEWTLGANALLASGRPRSCVGFIGDPAAGGNASVYWGHYCFGAPSPRGSTGRLPWDQRLDLNVTYRPERVKGLSLRVDLFNAFNKQHIEAVNEQSVVTLASGQPIAPTYGRVLAYSSPRSVKFTARYDF